jgi:hypothetical protein
MIEEPRKRSAVARSRKNADEALLRGLACGATVENAARAAGISARTAHRRLKEEKFQKQLRDLRAEMVQRTAGLLTASGLEAGKTLMSLLDPTMPAAVRHAASRSILEYGLKVREIAELEARLAALEARSTEPPC